MNTLIGTQMIANKMQINASERKRARGKRKILLAPSVIAPGAWYWLRHYHEPETPSLTSLERPQRAYTFRTSLSVDTAKVKPYQVLFTPG